MKISIHVGFIILLVAGAFGLAGCRGLPAQKSVPATVDRNRVQWANGGIIRGDQNRKAVAIAFTGHEFAEGGETIVRELKKHGARASFFFTGDFLANATFHPLVKRIAADGHYISVHSDKHLLYCSWDKNRETLITEGQFRSDLGKNVRRYKPLGLAQKPGRFLSRRLSITTSRSRTGRMKCVSPSSTTRPARGRMRTTQERRRGTSSRHRPSSTAS